MPKKMPDLVSEITRDDTLTASEKLLLIEGLFVHDSVGQPRDGWASVEHVGRASRRAPRAESARARPRGRASSSRP